MSTTHYRVDMDDEGVRAWRYDSSTNVLTLITMDQHTTAARISTNDHPEQYTIEALAMVPDQAAQRTRFISIAGLVTALMLN